MNTANSVPGATRRPARPSPSGKGQRFEGVTLTLILLTVGVSAGAASFTHVHDWTMQHSPADTGDWFGWANAVISELVPVAALLVMRRRRRTGQPVAYPAFLLVSALAFSITAQLAVAKPGLSGALVAVVPALAFAALAKLILGKDPQPDDGQPVPHHTNPIPATVSAQPAVAVPAQVTNTAVPVRDDQPRQPVDSPTSNTAPTPAPAPVAAVVKTAAVASVKAAVIAGAPLPAVLLDRARQAADDFLAEHGRSITRDELRAVLRVSNSTTGDIMRALGLADRPRVLAPALTAVSPLTGQPLLPTQ